MGYSNTRNEMHYHVEVLVFPTSKMKLHVSKVAIIVLLQSAN